MRLVCRGLDVKTGHKMGDADFLGGVRAQGGSPEGYYFNLSGYSRRTPTGEQESDMDREFTVEEMQKAVENYEKRRAYNAAWRERHPEKVKATRKAYNQRRWATEKAARAAAKEHGLA